MSTELEGIVEEIRGLSVRALRRMYRRDKRVFAFTLRRFGGRDVLEGTSRRYTAVVLLALADESADLALEVLSGHEPYDVCGRLIDAAETTDDLGEVALTLWAAGALRHPRASAALRRLRSMRPAEAAQPTVELSWALTALTIDGSEDARDEPLARLLAARLLASYRKESSLFPHWPDGAAPSWLRSHVACFADVVYPIQALSYFHRAMGCEQAASAACACARRMCGSQGAAGQWWWHYDVRTGDVIERYPVYSVHQDAMAPMALFTLQDACGVSAELGEAAERGLRWLLDPPESEAPLLDREGDVIWRKVARHEPGKLVRSLQAGASRVHSSLRVPGTNLLFRPGRIDYETRPYHMAWILHAWSARRRSRLAERVSGR